MLLNDMGPHLIFDIANGLIKLLFECVGIATPIQSISPFLQRFWPWTLVLNIGVPCLNVALNSKEQLYN